MSLLYFLMLLVFFTGCGDKATSLESSDGVSSSSTLSSSFVGDTSGTFIDERDNQTYRYVKIGDQVWMAENLNYETDSNSYCYEDDPDNCNVYGRLYNKLVALDGSFHSSAIPSGIQGLCPSGWHLPSDAEWDVLASYVANETQRTGKSEKGNWNEIGNLLKANSSLWNPNTGTDDYGFSGLPGGKRDKYGDYGNLGYYGYWWSTTDEENSIWHLLWRLDSSWDTFYHTSLDLHSALSVRCLRY